MEEAFTINAKVVAVSNQKNGMGKTVTTINLGIGLARQGKRILLIDADPLSCLTNNVGITKLNGLRLTLTEVIKSSIGIEPEQKKKAVPTGIEGLYLIPADNGLEGIDATLANISNGELALKNWLKKVKDEYDYILIDCASSLGELTVTALAAADKVLVPFRGDCFSTRGIRLLMATVDRIQESLNPDLEILGVLLTMVDKRDDRTDSFFAQLQSGESKLRLLDTVIPFSVRIANCKPVSKGFHAFSKASSAYSDLVNEISRLLTG